MGRSLALSSPPCKYTREEIVSQLVALGVHIVGTPNIPQNSHLLAIKYWLIDRKNTSLVVLASILKKNKVDKMNVDTLRLWATALGSKPNLRKIELTRFIKDTMNNLDSV